MIVSYPMYALPQMQQSLNLWWANLHQRLVEQGITTPELISEPDDYLMQHWLNPDLLLSHTCGFPLISKLKARVKLVGTPVFSAHACEGPNYCSFYIVQKHDHRTELKDYQDDRFAYNGTDSQSGFNAVRMNLIEQELSLPFFGENILSGGHRNSILTVGKGEADICAVDCVTHSLLRMHQPEVLDNTRILANTKYTPGLPLITSIKTSDEVIEAMFNAINEVCEDESMKSICRDLQLDGIKKVSLDTYCQVIRQSISPIEKL